MGVDLGITHFIHFILIKFSVPSWINNLFIQLGTLFSSPSIHKKKWVWATPTVFLIQIPVHVLIAHTWVHGHVDAVGDDET